MLLSEIPACYLFSDGRKLYLRYIEVEYDSS